MERVAFLIEETGERVFALINPDELIFQRQTGIGVRQCRQMPLASAKRSDDPIIYVGGGVTDLKLNLLFDVDLLARTTPSFANSPHEGPSAGQGASRDQAAAADFSQDTSDGHVVSGAISRRASDVRELSGPLWRLTENGAGYEIGAGPPALHFIWGAAWNIPCVALRVAERFDQFSADGAPLRSWVSLHLRRTSMPEPETHRSDGRTDSQPRETEFNRAPPDEAVVVTDPISTTRPDRLCDSVYGDVSLVRPLMRYNDIDDFWSIEFGRVLLTPPASVLRRSQP